MSNGKLNPLAVSTIGVASVLLGAVLGHFLSLKEKRVFLLDDARRQAYLAFLVTREEPAELKSAEEDKETTDAAAAKAEKSGDKKEAKDLRVRVSELDKKRSALEEQFYANKRVAWNSIAIFGNSQVVRSLATFQLQALTNLQPCYKSWGLDVQVYQAMRRSLVPEEESVSDKDLAAIILMCVAPDQR